MADQELFSRDLISPEVSAVLPEGYVIRPLRRSDYKTGFLDCLRVLTTVGNISEDQFTEQWDWMAAQKGTYYVLVIENTATSRIIATGALLLERKLFVPDFPFPSRCQFAPVAACSFRRLSNYPLQIASTRSARPATSKTLQSTGTSKARSSDFA